MGTREKKIFDAAHELAAGGPQGNSARMLVDGVRAKSQRLLAAASDKVKETVSQNPEKMLQTVRQGTGE